MFPSALPARRETQLQRLGHDPDRLRQQLRVLHRARRARRRDEPPVRRRGRRGAPARRRRRHRGHAARPERQQLRPRPPARGPPGRRRQRPSAPAVRRSAARRRRGRRHPPRPLHQPAPEGHAARDVRGDGRDAGGVRAPALPAAVGQRPRARRDAPRLHRRALPRTLAEARAAVPDLAVSTDIIVGFPGETDDDFERTLEVAAAAEYDYAYTFIFSPRPGTEAADDGRPTSSTRPWRASASTACASSSSASALRQARGAGRAHRGGPRRGSERRRTRPWSPAAPARTSSSTSTPPHPLRTGSYATVEITARRPAPPRRAASSSSSPSRRTSIRIPVAAL